MILYKTLCEYILNYLFISVKLCHYKKKSRNLPYHSYFSIYSFNAYANKSSFTHLPYSSANYPITLLHIEILILYICLKSFSYNLTLIHLIKYTLKIYCLDQFICKKICLPFVILFGLLFTILLVCLVTVLFVPLSSMCTWSCIASTVGLNRLSCPTLSFADTLFITCHSLTPL